MYVDTKENFDFSAAFHPKATKEGVAVIITPEMSWIVAADIDPATFDPVIDSYCGFKCFRDLQSFVAVRGWTVKEEYKDTVLGDNNG
jgi:hypothetical protein